VERRRARPGVVEPLRFGLVGPGRTRNGLGPFLAKHLAVAGGRVVAVAGRDPARTAAAAAALGRDLGWPVAAHASLADLVGRGDIDALVIASPIDAHLPALRAALAARLPALCEKPLADRHAAEEVQATIAAFAAEGLLLAENCQWPFALAALQERGVVPRGLPRSFAMRLSPTGRGREMLVESLSHPLSLVQALAGEGAAWALVGAAFSTRAPDAEAMRVELELDAGGQRCALALELVRCPEQPRPAWFALDGVRCERELILPAYRWGFRHQGGFEDVGDPQAALVYGFVASLPEPDLDLIRRHAATLAARARLFTDVVVAFDAGA